MNSLELHNEKDLPEGQKLLSVKITYKTSDGMIWEDHSWAIEYEAGLELERYSNAMNNRSLFRKLFNLPPK